MTIRKKMTALLSEGDRSARDLSMALGVREKEVYGHLEHIERSVKVSGRRLIVKPFKCYGCGFVFKGRKRFTKPGKCPRCRSTHLEYPMYRII